MKENQVLKHALSQTRIDRGWIGPHRDAGEAPSWHVRLYDERPARRADVLLIERIIRNEVDVDGTCFDRTSGQKLH